MNILNVFLDYFDVLTNIATKLFDQWDSVETVATRMVHLAETLLMAILQRL